VPFDKLAHHLDAVLGACGGTWSPAAGNQARAQLADLEPGEHRAAEVVVGSGLDPDRRRNAAGEDEIGAGLLAAFTRREVAMGAGVTASMASQPMAAKSRSRPFMRPSTCTALNLPARRMRAKASA